MVLFKFTADYRLTLSSAVAQGVANAPPLTLCASALSVTDPCYTPGLPPPSLDDYDAARARSVRDGAPVSYVYSCFVAEVNTATDAEILRSSLDGIHEPLCLDEPSFGPGGKRYLSVPTHLSYPTITLIPLMGYGIPLFCRCTPLSGAKLHHFWYREHPSPTPQPADSLCAPPPRGCPQPRPASATFTRRRRARAPRPPAPAPGPWHAAPRLRHEPPPPVPACAGATG